MHRRYARHVTTCGQRAPVLGYQLAQRAYPPVDHHISVCHDLFHNEWGAHCYASACDAILCSAGRQTARQPNPAPVATWSRPTPDRNEEWTKPSYIPQPGQSPVVQPSRRDDQPLYAPSAPEFTPAERPEQGPEMPKGPTLPGQGRAQLASTCLTLI